MMTPTPGGCLEFMPPPNVDASAALLPKSKRDEEEEGPRAPRWEGFFRIASCCQASVEQSKHRVFPVPVGDSNMALEEVEIASIVFVM